VVDYLAAGIFWAAEQLGTTALRSAERRWGFFESLKLPHFGANLAGLQVILRPLFRFQKINRS